MAAGVSREAIGDGDRDAKFEELAVPLFPSLYNFASWLTRDRDEAEDLVQEAYARALRGFGSFTPGTSFKAWIFRILKNCFLTSRSGLRAHAAAPLDDLDDGSLGRTEETPESILIARSSRERLRAAIEELPPVFKEIVLLRDVEGLTYQEIGEVLQVPNGTVMSRLSRARKAIRAAIGKEGV